MSQLITVLYVVAALTGASFALVELRLLLRFVRNRTVIRQGVRSTARAPVAAGIEEGRREEPPTVTIQIPLFNERTSAEASIRAAAAQDYPRDRFDIQVLDDSTDETTAIVARVVEAVRAEGVRIEHLHREDRVGYKAGALAAGLARSDAEFVAVFDADFTPHPGFLSRLLVEEDVFSDQEVAFVQTRWAWDQAKQHGLFHAALALLLDRHFYVQKPTRAWLGDVTTFNGSGGIWRRVAIDSAGGWSADTLTEDLDLSYRCAFQGWQGRYLQDVSVESELPGHMRAFKLQQRRWARGNAQCFRKLYRKVMGSKGMIRDRWEEAFLLAGYAIHPILVANLLLWPWAVLYVDRAFFWVMQGLMSLVTLVAPLSFIITLRERDQPLSLSSAGHLLVGLCVGIGLMVNNTVGQVVGFLAGEGEFVRTPKGVRSSSDGGVGALGAKRPYLLGLDWTVFLEASLVGYSAFGAGLLVSRGEALWALPLLFWGMCLALVVQLQVRPASA